jgi:hypothetical protein
MIDRVGIEIMCRFYGDVACCTRSAGLPAERGSSPESFDHLVAECQVEQASIDAARVREMKGLEATAIAKAHGFRPGERLSAGWKRAICGRSHHLPTSERWLARFPCTDKDADDADSQGGWRVVMVGGLFAVLLFGTLAGSIGPEPRDDCYRTPCHPRYSRDFCGGYGECGGAGAYGECDSYRGYAGCAGYGRCGGYRWCGNYGYGW